MKNFDLKEKKANQEQKEGLISFFEWKEKETSQKDIKWQIGAIIFLILAMVLFLKQKNFFGIITILMIIFIIFFISKKEEEIYCAILKQGFRIKNEIFRWENIESFWIFENLPELSLKIKKGTAKNILVPIKKGDTKRIKKLLLKFLPEEETQISLGEVITRKLGL